MKFNRIISRKNEKITRNYEGEKAYRVGPKMELYTAVVTSTLERNFYESGSDRLERIKKLICKVDPYFVAQLAVYAREEMHLRSIPLVMAVELAKAHQGDDLVRRMVRRVIARADEITEILAYYQFGNNRKDAKKLNGLSKQLQKGIADAFNKFDAYQFAKYNRDAEVKLKDALFLTHPKAESDEQQVIFDQIAKDELITPYTWEVELSKVGQMSYENSEAKAEAVRNCWEALIDSGKLGYMAMMRNLRNMLQAGISNVHLEKVAAYLSDEGRVKKSRQLPFRFLAAYRELKVLKDSRVAYLLSALETAIRHSVSNLKGFDLDEHVLIACDVSGSMQRPVSAKSKILNYDIGLLLGMLIRYKSKNVTTGMFGDTWKAYSLPQKNILENVQKLYSKQGMVGYSTNGYKVIESMLIKRKKVDKFMIFTDCQMWNSQNDGKHFETLWKQYKAEIAPDAKLYLFDLLGYGQAPLDIRKNDVYLIAGWSEKIFEVLEAVEKGASTLSKVETITL